MSETSRTVWKYQLKMGSSPMIYAWEPIYTLYMPYSAEFLSARTQSGVPCMWFLVHPGRDQEKREFVIAGTGKKITQTGLKFLGTFFLDEGHFVGHIFEVIVE